MPLSPDLTWVRGLSLAASSCDLDTSKSLGAPEIVAARWPSALAHPIC